MTDKNKCIAMKTVLRWIIWLIILGTLFPGGIFSQRVPVLINQRATLIRNASSCENGKLVKSYPTKATIATCQKHTCVIEEDFLEKMELEETSNNLVFKSAKYNDWGTYEFICNGKEPISPTRITLEVIDPQNKTARPMSNITLTCYATNPNDVTWLHNDKTILNCMDKRCTSFGEGYESRASLNEGCFEDGDCSLTLIAVSEMDAGLYSCLAEDESPKGSARAHMVDVKEDHSNPEGNHTESNKWYNIAIIFILISVGLLVALCKVSYRCIALSKAANQSTSTTASHTPNENEPSENHPMLASITTQHDNSQATEIITQPVQESDNNLKSSSTMPFYTGLSGPQ